MAAERGLLGLRGKTAPAALKERSKLNWLYEKIILVTGVFFDIAKLRWDRSPVMYVSTRKLDLAEDLIYSSVNKVCLVGDPRNAGRSRCKVNAVGLTKVIQLSSMLVIIPRSVKKEAQQRSNKLKKHFNSDVDYSKIIREKYKESRATLFFWKLIFLFNGRVTDLFFINTDTHRPIIEIAKKNGAKVTEVQHGYMGESHFAFNYPKLDFSLATLPDEVWVDRLSSDITYPVPCRVIKTQVAETNPKDLCREIDILIGAAPNRHTELLTLLDILVEFDVSVAVKLHPKGDDVVKSLSRDYSRDAVTFYRDGFSFLSLAQRSTTFIPINPNSTTVFEANDCGSRVLIFNQQGYVVTTMSQEFELGQANSQDELISLLGLKTKRHF